MKASFLNVGHGDMSLVEVAGKKILVDFNLTNENNVIDDFRKLVPDKKIDYLFITHLHKDHISGLKLLHDDGFTFGKIYENGYRFEDGDKEGKTEAYEYAVKFLKENNAEIPKASLTKFNPENDFEIYCLNSPNQDDETVHYNSLVIKIVENDKSILFTGDSNCEIWQESITEDYDELIDADILHASHHGSRTFFFKEGQDYKTEKAYEEHVEAISPTFVIVSAPNEDDKQDDWPPHQEALNIYEKYSSRKGGIYITGEKDNMVFETTSEGFNVSKTIISEKYQFIPGKYQPKLETPRIATSNNTKQSSLMWG